LRDQHSSARGAEGLGFETFNFLRVNAGEQPPFDSARERSLELMFLVARGLETALAGLADRFIVRAS
jgi:hypothetical protein